MNADILAAVMSQQKNMSVLYMISNCDASAAIYLKNLRKQDLVVPDDLEPVRTLDVNFRVTLVQAQGFEEMSFLRCAQNLRSLREIGN
jgi:hypothetical protein